MAVGEPDLTSQDLEMMSRAIELAKQALEVGEVPVGAVVVQAGRVISEAHNLREALSDPTAHAERLALTLAGKALGTWRLDGCTMYVTLEPCPMCAGAIGLSRITRLVYGASDPKAGACRSLYRLIDDPRYNHRVQLTSEIRAKECGQMLTNFFQRRRLT